MGFWDTIEEALLGDFNRLNMTQKEALVYSILKQKLGTHLTLNNNVPQEVGCAECASAIFKLAGYTMPAGGIPGTLAMLAWAHANLVEIHDPEQGAFIINATTTGNGDVEGHCGFIAAFGLMYVGDWGICSNDSNTGTLREQWCLKDWLAWYEAKGGMKTHYFRVG